MLAKAELFLCKEHHFLPWVPMDIYVQEMTQAPNELSREPGQGALKGPKRGQKRQKNGKIGFLLFFFSSPQLK